ncbi:unnamed protein product [Coffea canephora]|uniref:DH200=94 genomic scaffold, scaffold_7558 n=1 Tax=Coffea canephora TaxID=49390 RepID=A0A068VM64_COFCA|nr:unnamed protein product [Coffea canephora]
MSKRTKNAMVVGKFDTLSGASLPRQIENMEASQHSLYLFKFCGKYGVKREAFGNLGMQRLWEGKAQYTLNTSSAVTVRSIIQRLREQIGWIQKPVKANNIVLDSNRKSFQYPGHLFFSEKNSWIGSLEELEGSLKDVPWKAFFKSKAVWAMIYAHFCGSWGHYTCLSWLPTYFSEELSLNLTEAAWVSVLPPLASIFVTSIAAQLADYLITKGVDTTRVRKTCQTISFLSPTSCMILSSLDLGLPPWEVVTILTGGLALSSFALSGI